MTWITNFPTPPAPGRKPEKWRKTGQKSPPNGAVFFALPPPFWYGFSLESWAPLGLAQTQAKHWKNGVFGSLRHRKADQLTGRWKNEDQRRAWRIAESAEPCPKRG